VERTSDLGPQASAIRRRASDVGRLPLTGTGLSATMTKRPTVGTCVGTGRSLSWAKSKERAIAARQLSAA